jgi:putative transposase
MKKSKFTEEQIAFALRQSETGTTVAEVCRKMGISDATFYNWKKKYGGLGVAELRRLRQLEEENRKLRQLVADLSLDKAMLQEVVQKSSEADPAQGLGWPSSGVFRRERAACLRRDEPVTNRLVLRA